MTKTTIELDEEKLRRVMDLTGIKTRKEAVDYALAPSGAGGQISQAAGKFLEQRGSGISARPRLQPAGCSSKGQAIEALC
jgi:hypothetical protein